MNPQELPIHRGVTVGFFARNGYHGSEQARREVDRMVETNVEWACLVVTVWQDTFASARQYRDFKMSPADDELRDLIDYMHEKGLKVQLRPMLECWDGSSRCHVWFPPEGEIFPGMKRTHWDDWFGSLNDRTLHYGALARRAGCEMYGIDSELCRTVGQQKHWREAIAAARSVFPGHVTTSHTAFVDYVRELETHPDHWFKELDSLGTSFYHQSADHLNASVEHMVQKMHVKLVEFRRVAELLGKPFYFGEVGCRSHDGAAMDPASWKKVPGYNGEEQANFLEAVCRSFWNEPWWMGMYWWKWDEHVDRPHYRDDPRGDKGFTVWGKPAAEVMKRWYGRPERRG